MVGGDFNTSADDVRFAGDTMLRIIRQTGCIDRSYLIESEGIDGKFPL